MVRDYVVRLSGREIRVRTGDNGTFSFDGVDKSVDIREAGEGRYSVLIDGVSVPVVVSSAPDGSLQLSSRGMVVSAVVETERDRLLSGAGGKTSQAGRSARVLAPMPALVIRVPVAVGDDVTKGQTLAILEAMKMENEVRAPMAGSITKLGVQEGQTVEKGALLVTIG